MKDKQITITQQELNEMVNKELMKKRRILFDMCAEEYFADIPIKERRFLWKKFVIMDKKYWDILCREFAKLSEDLMDARELLEITEPFFKRYRDFHEPLAENQYNSFDEYMDLMNATYTSSEFERVRDKYEEMAHNQLDDELER